MSYDLSPEEAERYEAAVRFARRALAERDVLTLDRDERFDREAWDLCAEFGLHALPVPDTGDGHGGLGAPLGEVLAAFEGLGYASRDNGLLFSIHAHLWTNSIPLARYGTAEQRARWLPGLCAGTIIGANAASEPDAGSDVFSMTTRARPEGPPGSAEAWVLDGAKTFVSNGPIADLFVAYATVDPALGPMGITAFAIPRDTPGLVVGAPLAKMGLRTSPMSEVVFDGCRVTREHLLGREGRGVQVFECSMAWERGAILAGAVGTMRRLLEQSIEYARTRRQFGRAIGKHQSVANRIVDMKVRLETARGLVYAVARSVDRGEPAMLPAALAKLYVAEAYIATCRDALQIHGGYGYMVEQGIERELRDALAASIYSGTSEIQRNLVARELGL